MSPYLPRHRRSGPTATRSVARLPSCSTSAPTIVNVKATTTEALGVSRPRGGHRRASDRAPAGRLITFLIPSRPSLALGPAAGLRRAAGARHLARESQKTSWSRRSWGLPPPVPANMCFLKVRKRNANTQWIARELAKLCGCHPRDVGYAGLKDRRAVALQWFSVPRSRLSPEAWREVRAAEFAVLEAAAHSRKLPRGALAGNRFRRRDRETCQAPSPAPGCR